MFGILTAIRKRLGWMPKRRLRRRMCDNPVYDAYYIGVGTYGSPRVLTWGVHGALRIGRYCSIAEGVTILLGGEHRLDWVTTFPLHNYFVGSGCIAGQQRTKGDVQIGNDVWIGRDAMVLSGARIGDGAVVGARSVVRGRVRPYEIVAGNPARFVGFRFSAERVAALLALRWWEWPEERIRQAMPLLLSCNVEGLCRFDRGQGAVEDKAYRDMGEDR